MKNGITLTIIALFILTACSTAPQVDNPQRIGTWNILSSERAKWNPTGSTSAYRVAFADSTSPDTTYFYDNGQIKAKIQEVSGEFYDGDFEFKITDLSLSSTVLYDSLDWGKTIFANLGDAFKVAGVLGTTLTPEKVTFKIQTNFNCSAQDNTKNLQLAFLSVPDSKGARDTVMVYELSTKGLYSTARYIACSN